MRISVVAQLPVVLVLVLVVGVPGVLRAEVKSSAAGGFQIHLTRVVAIEPGQAYACIEKVGRWWSDAHTYTGAAANLSMDFQKGWFQEKLADGGFVRHLDIVYHQPGKLLRMTGGLGPLQGLGLDGALTMTLSAQDGKTRIEWTYIVSGYAPDGLAKLAPLVDGVLTEQLDRLCRFCESGSPMEGQNDGGAE